MAKPSQPTDPAFTALYEREFPLAAHAAYVVTGSTARSQDIAQEALTAAYVKWEKVRRLDRPGAWVRRVAINIAVSDRRRSVRQELRDRTPDQRVDGPEAPDEELADAIRGLPVQQRLAVVLHYFHDLPVTEVASSMGCTVGTVKVHLHRGRRNLADALGPGGGAR